MSANDPNNSPNDNSAITEEFEVVAEAIGSLTEAEMRKLTRKALQYSWGVLNNLREDIFAEAVTDTLAMKYRWNRDRNPTMYDHLWWTIRTVAYGKRQKLTKDGKPRYEYITDEDIERLCLEHNDGELADLVRQYEVNELVDIILEYFKYDTEIAEFIECRSLRYNKKRIKKELGIDEKRYNALDKKIRRKCENLRKRLKSIYNE